MINLKFFLFCDFVIRWLCNVIEGSMIYMYFVKLVLVIVRIVINSKIVEKVNFCRYFDNLEFCNEIINRCKILIFEDCDSLIDC